jgi:hypothetical protein
LALDRLIEPVGIVVAGNNRYLRLRVNGKPLTIPASWPSTRSNDAARVLADYGISLTARQVQPLQTFVADALENGTGFPVENGAELLGWNGSNLVLGQVDDPIVFIPRLDSQFVAGFGKRVTSTEEDAAKTLWQIALANVSGPAWVVCGAAAVSPLLRLLPVQFHPFIVHLIGPRNTGKTTILYAGAALYGDPAVLVATWNLTLVGLERLLETAHDLPAFLDETGVVEHQETLGPRVMMVASGVGRVRGSSDGMRPVATWRNITLGTGETAPLVAAVSGAARRVLLVHKALETADQVNALNMASADAYGWPAFWLRPLWEDHQRWTEAANSLSPEYEELLRAYPGAIVPQGRMWALADVGAQMLARALGLDPQRAADAVWAIAIDSAQKQGDRLDTADKLLWAVEDDITANAESYNGSKAPKVGVRGRFLGSEKGVAVLRSTLEFMAARYHIADLDAILNVLKDRGKIIHDPGRMTTRRRIGGGVVRCHVLRLEGFTQNEEVTDGSN